MPTDHFDLRFESAEGRPMCQYLAAVLVPRYRFAAAVVVDKERSCLVEA